MRGTPQQHVLGGRPVTLLPLFHPAAGLRTPAVKEQLREDFRLIPKLIEAPLPERQPVAADGALAEASVAEPLANEPAPVEADQLGLFGG